MPRVFSRAFISPPLSPFFLPSLSDSISASPPSSQLEMGGKIKKCSNSFKGRSSLTLFFSPMKSPLSIWIWKKWQRKRKRKRKGKTRLLVIRKGQEKSWVLCDHPEVKGGIQSMLKSNGIPAHCCFFVPERKYIKSNNILTFVSWSLLYKW